MLAFSILVCFIGLMVHVFYTEIARRRLVNSSDLPRKYREYLKSKYNEILTELITYLLCSLFLYFIMPNKIIFLTMGMIALDLYLDQNIITTIDENTFLGWKYRKGHPKQFIDHETPENSEAKITFSEMFNLYYISAVKNFNLIVERNDKTVQIIATFRPTRNQDPEDYFSQVDKYITWKKLQTIYSIKISMMS